MAHGNVTDEELAELIQRIAEAAKAYIRGDMRTYFTLIRYRGCLFVRTINAPQLVLFVIEISEI